MAKGPRGTDRRSTSVSSMRRRVERRPFTDSDLLLARTGRPEDRRLSAVIVAGAGVLLSALVAYLATGLC